MSDQPRKPAALNVREKAFKEKIAHQHRQPLGKPPVPTDAPRIVPDPLKGKK
jgi:hypothetical protein